MTSTRPPLRVLLTHDRFAPDFGGGGEVVVLETARHLRARGVEVHVLTTGRPELTEYEGIPVQRLRMPRHLLNLAIPAIARASAGCDLIHSFNYHACFPSLHAARQVQLPVVCTILGLCGDAWHEMKGPLLGPAWKAWEGYLTRLPYDRTLFLSSFSLEDGVALGADRARSRVTGPGLDLSLYRCDVPKEDVVLFVGKLDVRKGVHEILEVARRLPEVRFRMVGWGEDSRLEQRAGPNVKFAGLVRGEALRDEFARARLFLLPSRGETFGIALLEAMACGCAPISSIPLPFEGERVRFGDVEEMTAAVRRLWEDRPGSLELGRRNAAIARRFTWDAYTDAVLDAYQEVLGPPIDPRSSAGETIV